VEYTSEHNPLSVDVSGGAETSMNRFTLDTVIEDEGGNLSIGQVCGRYQCPRSFLTINCSQRSLVSLARALVKDSKVIIMDEATGSLTHLHLGTWR
jgi:ABC-type transport system involved in cytochrome bd biosynthesis fused ATPase/permease subunit